MGGVGYHSCGPLCGLGVLAAFLWASLCRLSEAMLGGSGCPRVAPGVRDDVVAPPLCRCGGCGCGTAMRRGVDGLLLGTIAADRSAARSYGLLICGRDAACVGLAAFLWAPLCRLSEAMLGGSGCPRVAPGVRDDVVAPPLCRCCGCGYMKSVPGWAGRFL